MKPRKTFIALIAVLLAFLLLAGCGDTTDKKTGSKGPSSSTTNASSEPSSSDDEDSSKPTSEPSNSDDENSSKPTSEPDSTDQQTPPPTTPDNVKWDEDGVLKILTIGNSFSDDSMEYVYNIATSAGVKKVVLGNLYIGGCTLHTHLNNATGDAAAYEYRTNTVGRWSTQKNYKMSDALKSQNWDFISLQQASGSSGMPNTYSVLNRMIEYVKLRCPDASIVWNMTWAYQQNSGHSEFKNYGKNQQTMYNAIVSTVQAEVMKHKEIYTVIPTGTAIQNARTSYIGDNLTRDGYHLTTDFGRYVAGMTFVRKLAGVSIDSVTYRPSKVDADMQKIAIESANNAVERPFEVTNSKYNKTQTVDVTGMSLLDLEMTPLGYWNSTDSSKHHQIITNAHNSANFYATKMFTKNDIPVGSVIVIEAGWNYRPEAWKDNKVQSAASRPANVSASHTVVTEAWWEGYQTRAFNVSKLDGSSLSGSAQAATALKIYIPKK